MLASDDKNNALPELIIAVNDEHRGVGIGRRLMQGLQELVVSRGTRGLALSVSPRNEPAVRLYRACGFVDLGQTPSGLSVMIWYSEDRS